MNFARSQLIILLTAAAIGCAGSLDPNQDYSSSQTLSPAGKSGNGPSAAGSGGPAGSADPPEADNDAGTPSGGSAGTSAMRDAAVPNQPPEEDDDAGTPVADAGKPDAGKTDASTGCDFKGLVQMKCGNINCHGAPASSTGLDLTSASLATRLAGRKGATACNDKLLINTADPAQSMLYLKVTGSSCGVKMPLGGSLSSDEEACVLSWIEGL
jgi:hypothetical protein